MFLSNYAIARPTATIVLMIAIVVSGLFALFTLQTDEFPELDPPVIAVSILYPGAAALTVERELVDPVEESLADPRRVFDSFIAPLALIGVVVALIVTGDTLNIMSLIGVVLLAGIITKESILLIDFARRHERQGAGRHEGLREAGRIRLRPILMTTGALVAGMLPVAIGFGEGADFRAPLGRAVVGGTLASTALPLLVIPTVYDVLESGREWLSRRFRGAAALPGRLSPDS